MIEHFASLWSTLGWSGVGLIIGMGMAVFTVLLALQLIVDWMTEREIREAGRERRG